MMPPARVPLASLAMISTLATNVAAQPDKGQYHLFHPTPRELLREMSTDRPDKTESPFTVDAGHFQVEMDLLSYTRDRDTSGGGDVRTDAWAIAPVNLRLGLLNDTELQWVIETYNRVHTTDRVAGTSERQAGIGDLTLRLKRNFWGNDGGSTAFAVMPFVKLPLNQDNLGNHAVEGGVIFPLSVELPAGWSLGLMTEADLLCNDANRSYCVHFVNSITFGHNLAGKLDGYIEFFSDVSTKRRSCWVGTVDVGLTYGITSNVQLDAGVNIGVTKSAEDVNPFLGLSWRF